MRSGAWFASQNQLPTSVIECIQFHHAPADAGKYRGLAAVVSTADHMANYSQRELHHEDYDVTSHPHWPFMVEYLGVAEELLREKVAVDPCRSEPRCGGNDRHYDESCAGPGRRSKQRSQK